VRAGCSAPARRLSINCFRIKPRARVCLSIGLRVEQYCCGAGLELACAAEPVEDAAVSSMPLLASHGAEKGVLVEINETVISSMRTLTPNTAAVIYAVDVKKINRLTSYYALRLCSRSTCRVIHIPSEFVLS